MRRQPIDRQTLPYVLMACTLCNWQAAHRGTDLEQGRQVLADRLLEHAREQHQGREVTAC